MPKYNQLTLHRIKHLPTLTAELGCNHRGDLKTAFSMVDSIKKIPLLGIVKFQKRTISPDTLRNFYEAHPKPSESYGKTYGEHRLALEFSLDEHKSLKKYIESFSLDYMSSVWDMGSAEDIVSLKPKHIKIPSAKNLDERLVDYVLSRRVPLVHVSLGLLIPSQIKNLIKRIAKKAIKNQRIVFYFCVSGYPTPPTEACLLEMANLKNELQQLNSRYLSLGFSNHDAGISLDAFSLLFGVTHIERHVTLNKTWKGTDQKFSLTPGELSQLGQNLTDCGNALDWRPKKQLLQSEKPSQKKLK